MGTLKAHCSFAIPQILAISLVIAWQSDCNIEDTAHVGKVHGQIGMIKIENLI